MPKHTKPQPDTDAMWSMRDIADHLDRQLSTVRRLSSTGRLGKPDHVVGGHYYWHPHTVVERLTASGLIKPWHRLRPYGELPNDNTPATDDN